MGRLTTYLLQALAALGDADLSAGLRYEIQPPRAFTVDLDDDASVRAAFRSIVEWEWGEAARGDG